MLPCPTYPAYSKLINFIMKTVAILPGMDVGSIPRKVCLAWHIAALALTALEVERFDGTVRHRKASTLSAYGVLLMWSMMT